MLEYDSVVRQAAQLLLPAGLGALVGARATIIANSYIKALVDGAPPDAATMRGALSEGLYWPVLSQWPHNEDGAREGLSSRALAGSFQISCAVLMACLLVLLHSLHQVGSLYFVAVAIASAILLILALIDLRSRLLPDSLTLPLMWLGLLLAWSGRGVELADAVAGAMMGYGFLWSLFWAFKGLTGHDGMGYGDFKLSAALGAWLGWRPLAAVILLACFTGVLFAMLRQRSWRPVGSYPFGPFLVAAGMAALLLGSEVHLYF